MKGLECGGNGCLGGAGDIILKGMAGRGANLVVGFFYHQIRIKIKEPVRRPGGVAGPIPDHGPITYVPDTDAADYNKVDVYLTIKWPFMETPKTMQFVMERRWANVVVNRIKQINTFNEQFTVKIGNIKNNFTVKFADLKNKFGVKWKK